MITAIDSLRKRISKTALFSAYLMLGTTISATFAVADDPPGAAFSSAHKLFVPMTQSARLRNYLAGLTGYQAILQSAASSGISQAQGKPEEWGGGAEGYGRRFGHAYAQNLIHRTLQYGISAALHEDDRYIEALKAVVPAPRHDGLDAYSPGLPPLIPRTELPSALLRMT